MQRAAASAPTSSPTTPTPDEPSPKRQKRDAESSPSTPSADLRAIQAALAAEEAKREEALERQAAEAGETKWFLSFRPEERDGGVGALSNGDKNGRGALRVMSAGYSGLDRYDVSTDQDEGDFRPAAVVGRRSFGRFNRALEVSRTRNCGRDSVLIVAWYFTCVLTLSLPLEAIERKRRSLFFI